VCEATADNRRVDSVTLIERFGNVVVGRGTLLPLLRRTSGVEAVVVHASFWSGDDGAFEEFVKALRTNERLRELTLYCFHRLEHPDLQLMEELLTAYNWTVETATVRSFSDIATRHRVLLLLATIAASEPRSATSTTKKASSFRPDCRTRRRCGRSPW
jgi:hypothetical protein